MKRKEYFSQKRLRERIVVEQVTRHYPHKSLCQICVRDVEWLPEQKVLAITGMDSAKLGEKVAAGELHIRITEIQQLYFCSESVLKLGSEPRPTIQLEVD